MHIEARGRDPISTCIVYAAAAAVLDSSGMAAGTKDSTGVRLLERLVQGAVDSFAPFPPSTPISVHRVMICVFVAKGLTALDDSTTAFLYLRHAVSMVETWRLDSKRIDLEDDGPRRHRLHWLLFVHERYQCISEYRTTVLRPLPQLPVGDSKLAAGTYKGFVRLVKLFLLLDDEFIAAWLDYNDAGTSDIAWISTKCEQFRMDEEEAETDSPHLSMAQQADLVVTRLWLMTLLWRIAMSQRLLPDTYTANLPLLSPVDVSRRLRQILERLPHQAIETHGVGIVQKLFELTDTMAEVVLHFPHLGSGTLRERVDDLEYLEQVVSASDRLDEVRRSILSSKFERLQTVVG